MRITEKLGYFLPDHLKPPLETASFAEFIAALKKYNVVSIVVVPSRKILFVTYTPDFGGEDDGTNYEYNVSLYAKGKGGRKINLYYPCSEKFLDEPDYRAANGRRMNGQNLIHALEEKYALTTIVTAAAKVAELTKIFPDCEIELHDADKVFTAEDYLELEKVARQQNIRPWSDHEQKNTSLEERIRKLNHVEQALLVSMLIPDENMGCDIDVLFTTSGFADRGLFNATLAGLVEKNFIERGTLAEERFTVGEGERCRLALHTAEGIKKFFNL